MTAMYACIGVISIIFLLAVLALVIAWVLDGLNG